MMSEGASCYYQGTTTPERKNIVDSYEKYLGVSAEELQRGLVLDLGSGARQQLAKELSGLDVQVVSLNPELRDEEVRNWSKKRILDPLRYPRWKRLAVAGIAQELPFKKGTFALVLANYSVPLYLKKEKGNLSKAFSEIIRVLRKSGEARIFPVTETLRYSPLFQSVLAEIRGAKVFFAEVSGVNDAFRMRIVKA